jgi:hypothetical protein
VAHVFAYGSLGHDRRGAPARLEGRRRTWGVAMDNRVVIPGYKVWLDPRDGRRPALHVLFLDLEEAPGHAVDGVLVPVAPEDLPALDRRERNYVRDDVAAALSPAPAAGAPALAYVGSPAGRARGRDGLRRGDAVVARAYLDAVTAAFGAAIPPPPVPVRDLERRDVPPLRPPASR